MTEPASDHTDHEGADEDQPHVVGAVHFLPPDAHIPEERRRRPDAYVTIPAPTEEPRALRRRVYGDPEPDE